MDVREKLSSKKRLIDYDEIRRLFDVQYKETVRLIRDGETHLDNLAEGFTEADRIIQKIPAVDAVEVVRCKDCIYAYRIDGPIEEYDCRKMSAFAKFFRPEHFCSYGELKEGAD